MKLSMSALRLSICGCVQVAPVSIDTDGEEIAIVREDDATNSVAVQGSNLPEGDTTTPAVETEVEVEVDD